MAKLIQITFTLPGDKADEAGLYLGQYARHGWEETQLPGDLIRFTIHMEDAALAKDLAGRLAELWPDAGVASEDTLSQDWAMAWKDFFTPVTCGERFEVLPPWLSGEAHEGLTPIVIEPKMAFGTGHHATTALCLEAIAELKAAGKLPRTGEFLDLGTGSGILGIGLAKLGLAGLGLDIDPQAVVCAVENAALNGVEENLRLAVGGLEALEGAQRFTLIVANILSGPLIELAPGIVGRLDSGAPLILSGILGEQAPAVARAYESLGLPAPRVKTQGEWAALVWD